MIEETLFSELSSNLAVVGLVGERIHHLARPESEEGAAIVYQRISTVPIASLSGESGLDSVRMQVSCIADTGLAAMEIAVAVRACIKASATLKGVPVMQVNDIIEPTGQRRSIVDFNLWQRF